MRALILVVAAAAIACVHQKRPAPGQPTGAPGVPGAVSPRPDVAPIVVASDGGVASVDATGAVTARLSATPARVPRLLAGGGLLFLTADARELRRIDGSGVESVVAALPVDGAGCEAGGATSVAGDAALVLHGDGTRACVQLARGDRALRVIVSLPGGELSGATCEPLGEDEAPPCVPAHAGSAPQPGRSPVTGYEPEAASPDGHWLVVGGNRWHGMGADRQLLLVDTRSGEVRLVCAGAWPSPLTADELDVGEVVSAGSIAIETPVPVRWLAPDLLLAGDLLLHVGTGGINLPGDVAF